MNNLPELVAAAHTAAAQIEAAQQLVDVARNNAATLLAAAQAASDQTFAAANLVGVTQIQTAQLLDRSQAAALNLEAVAAMVAQAAAAAAQALHHAPAVAVAAPAAHAAGANYVVEKLLSRTDVKTNAMYIPKGKVQAEIIGRLTANQQASLLLDDQIDIRVMIDEIDDNSVYNMKLRTKGVSFELYGSGCNDLVTNRSLRRHNKIGIRLHSVDPATITLKKIVPAVDDD